MKRALPLLSLLLFGVVSQMAAQTTYTSSTPFTCQAGGHYMPTSGQVECRGAWVGPVELLIGPGREFNLYDGAAAPPWELDVYDVKWGYSNFVQPSNCIPPKNNVPLCDTLGAFTITWSGPDMAGVAHAGTVKAAWNVMIDWRGWYHPILEATEVTVDY